MVVRVVSGLHISRLVLLGDDEMYKHFQNTSFFVNAGTTASEAELSPAFTKKWAFIPLRKILRAHHVFEVFCRRICLLSSGFGGLQ